MKVYQVIVSFAALGLALSLPANKNVEETTEKEVDKNVDFVPLGDKNFFPPGGVIDVDAGSFFGENPFGRTPLTSTFNSLEAAFTRMHQLMNRLLGRIPTESDFPELHIPNFGNVDLGKGNTTSVTKVINGHKVTINDTEYKSDEANGSSFFKVHIVEVHPDVDKTATTKDVEPVAPTKGEPESVEQPLNNEIPKVKDNEGSKRDENIETLDEVDVIPPQQWNKFTDTENFEDNRIDSAPSKAYDLSNDVYVNQLLADSGAKTNPDAEVFESLNGRVPSVQYYPKTRSTPIRLAPNYQYYGEPKYQQVSPYNSPAYYPSPMVSVNDRYLSRFQPDQIILVPLPENSQSYYIPEPAQASSSSTQSVNPNLQSTSTFASSKTAPSTT